MVMTVLGQCNRHQAAQMGAYLLAIRGLARAQDGDDAMATVRVIDLDRQEALLTVMSVDNADAGLLRVRTTRAASDNAVACIVRLVEEAAVSRAPIQRFVERFAEWWTPAAMVAALAVILVPPLLFGGDWWTWTYRGLALLLIALPVRLGDLCTSGGRVRTFCRGTVRVARERWRRAQGYRRGPHGCFRQDRHPDPGAARGHRCGAAGRRIRRTFAAALGRGRGARVLASAWSGDPGAGGYPGHRDSGGERRLCRSRSRRGGNGRRGLVAVGSPRHAAEVGTGLGEDTAQAEMLEAQGKTGVAILADGAVLGLISLRDEPRADAVEESLPSSAVHHCGDVDG
jgi:Cd2+/Zn2+-exporting ATPase